MIVGIVMFFSGRRGRIGDESVTQMFLSSISIWSTAAALLQVLGSLGIFLYGMKIMSEGV